MSTQLMFPCPLCTIGLEVRESKKDKPYVVCDSCGVQLFVRLPHGISRFRELIANAGQRNIWQTVEELKKQYRKTGPECGREFWIHESKKSTSWFDGEFVGYKCPASRCKGVVKVAEEGE